MTGFRFHWDDGAGPILFYNAHNSYDSQGRVVRFSLERHEFRSDKNQTYVLAVG